MTFFRWQKSSNSTSKTSTRDRRRVPRRERMRFKPWADPLEGRVVLTTAYFYPLDLPQLAGDIKAANNPTKGTTAVEIDLVRFAPIGPYTLNEFNPTVQGLGLSIVNNKSSSVTIPLRGTEFLWIGPNAGPVTVNGGPGIVLQNGKANSSRGSGSGNGGAIDYEDTNPSSALNVSNVTFTGNSATNDGGAIYAGPGSGPVDVNNSIFGTGSSATPGNTAGGNGGAIDYEGSYSLTITNSSFVGNSAGNPQRGGGGNGGAVEIGGSDGAAARCGTVSLTNCQFGTSYNPIFTTVGAPPLPPQGNTAMNGGGAIDYEAQLNNNSTSLSLTNVTFRQSNARYGGALFVGGGTGPVTMNGSKFGDTYPTLDNGTDNNRRRGGGRHLRRR